MSKIEEPKTNGFWVVGENYFIRTVTMALTGKLVEIDGTELVLQDAAWIADTGRYSNAIKDGTFSEIEPYPDTHKVLVNRTAIVDATQWTHELPRVQKP